MVDLVAFDIGCLGAIAYRDELGCVHSRPWSLEGKTVEAKLARLENSVDVWLHELQPSKVFIERHTRRGAGSQTLDACVNVIRLVCGRHGIAVERSIATMNASKLALRKGVADKQMRHKLAVPLLRIPKGCTEDEIDARILLAAIRGFERHVSLVAEVSVIRSIGAVVALRGPATGCRGRLEAP